MLVSTFECVEEAPAVESTVAVNPSDAIVIDPFELVSVADSV